MKAISLKARRSLDITGNLKGIAAAVAAKSVTIAVISAAVCLGAAIAGNDTALAAVRPHAAKEGGEI